MPPEGVPKIAHEDILSFDEIVRIAKAAAGLGVTKIRLTGGEPLVRKNLPALVRVLKNIPGISEIALTTNGTLLAPQMPLLAEAGLSSVNISLDTADPVLYEKITRGGKLEDALAGLRAVRIWNEKNPSAVGYSDTFSLKETEVYRNAENIRGKIEYSDMKKSMPEKEEYPGSASIPKSISVGPIRCKIDCVLLGLPEQKLTDVALFARDDGVHVRFIELMPIGMGRSFNSRLPFSRDTAMKKLKASFGPLTPDFGIYGNGPAEYYSLEGFRGKIGFISALSHKFCDKCNRIRLTPEGYLKTCLQYHEGADLKRLMRSGCTDSELVSAIREAVLKKPKEHGFYIEKKAQEEIAPMNAIGG